MKYYTKAQARFGLNLVILCSLLICSLLFLSGCGGDEAEAPAPAPAAEPVTANAPAATVAATATEEPAHAEHEATKTEESSQAEEPAPTDSNTVTFDISMHDSYYGDSDTNITDPPVWTAPKGSIIIINLTNHGKENHNWAIVKSGAQIPVPYEEGRESEILLVEPGMVYSNSQTQWVINAPEPGTYDIICTVSGHYPFMKGQLIITP